MTDTKRLSPRSTGVPGFLRTCSSSEGMRFFNTTGPVVAADHYRIPPLDRLDLPEVLGLVRDKRWFVLHAPRQTGKTTALLALRDRLAGDGYRCVYANVEVGQAGREDTARAMQAILGAMASRAWSAGDRFLDEVWSDLLARYGPDGALREALTRWSAADPRPLVLLIDEIDALVGDTLLSVLRQLREGYDRRPAEFPHSIVLCGVRDVRDYRIHSGSANAVVAGGSAFNVKANSLRLGDFSRGEVLALLGQHTTETGQAFTAEALDLVWKRTRGQPWLVNALADDACFRTRANRDRSRSIDADAVRAAQERLILRRETHLDQLADKLQEDRVRRVVEPLLSGAEVRRFIDRDLEYVRDLGLVARDRPVRIANPIYAEVVPRELTWVAQDDIEQEMTWYVDADGGLNVSKLLAAFQSFFREHSEHWRQRFQYQEAWPQLLLQAFLQRIVNSGGRIEREYGLGRGRTDLLLVWPLRGASDAAGGGADRRAQQAVIECKVARGSLERTIAEGTEQTAGYLDRCAAQEGHLVVFDRGGEKSWEEKIFRREASPPHGRTITVWGM